MNKSELKNIIKKITKGYFDGTSSDDKPTPEDELPISTKYSRFNLLLKFPKTIEVLENLMTNDFELFIKDIFWVAPKPTTFKIMLINDQHFFLMYDPISWIAQIEGKKYYLVELRDSELASEAVSRILRYGKVEKTNPAPPKEETSPTGEAPPAEETPPTEETPTA